MGDLHTSFDRGRILVLPRKVRSMLIAQIMVPCLSGKQCLPDWGAIAAIGGWFAAAVTFLAVLLPFWRQKCDRRAITRVAKGKISIALRDLERRLSAAYSFLSQKEMSNAWFSKLEWEMLRLPPLAVVLDANSDTEGVLTGLSRLLEAQYNLSTAVEGFASESGPTIVQNNKPGFEHLKRQLDAVRAAIEDLRAKL
jgi:hypothetical protein